MKNLLIPFLVAPAVILVLAILSSFCGAAGLRRRLAPRLKLRKWPPARSGCGSAGRVSTDQFCGSKARLATRAPIAGVLHSAACLGAVVPPLKILPQLQRVICAVIAGVVHPQSDRSLGSIYAAATW